MGICEDSVLRNCFIRSEWSVRNNNNDSNILVNRPTFEDLPDHMRIQGPNDITKDGRYGAKRKAVTKVLKSKTIAKSHKNYTQIISHLLGLMKNNTIRLLLV